MTEGCYRHTCHNSIWRHTLEQTICCYQGQAFSPNSVMFTETSEDGCITTEIQCKEEEKQAKPVLQVENRCSMLPVPTQKDVIEEMANTVDDILEEVVGRVETVEEKFEEMKHLLEFQMYKLGKNKY